MRCLLLALLLLSASVVAQPLTYQRIVLSPSWLTVADGTSTDDGGYVGAGWTAFKGDNSQCAYLVRLDSLGALQWSYRFTDLLGQSYLSRLAKTLSGSFIATGTLITSSSQRRATVSKFDASGALLWHKTIAGGEGMTSAADNDGYIFSGNLVQNGVPGAYLFKTDTNGAVLWQRFYLGAGSLRFRLTVPASDGDLFIAADEPVSPDPAIVLMRLTAGGDVRWTKRYRSDSLQSLEVSAGQQTTDGGYIIAGHFEHGSAHLRKGYLLKADSSGALSWSKAFDLVYGPHFEQVAECTASSGYVITGGRRAQGSTGEEGFLMRTDDTGAVQWLRRYGSSGGGYFCDAYQNTDGGFTLAGSTINKPTPVGYIAAYFVKTDSNGHSGCYEKDIAVTSSNLELQLSPFTLSSANPSYSLVPHLLTSYPDGTPYTICSAAAVSAPPQKPKISVSPNPSTTSVAITTPGRSISAIVLTDPSGTEVRRQSGNGSDRVSLDVSTLPAGIYIYTLTFRNEPAVRGKLQVIP